MILLLMGVAGSGKTTIGLKLAAALGWRFDDADAFHPAANVVKMASGLPLTDDDRAPWLAALRQHIDGCIARSEDAILTCSALKANYRKQLLDGAPPVRLIYLKGSPDLLKARLSARADHFMKPAMLGSQLASLEEPLGALTVDISKTPDEIVALVRRSCDL